MKIRKIWPLAMVPPAVMILLLGLGGIMASRAQAPLDTSSNLGLFTSLADNFIEESFGVSATNIPVFTNNTFVYTPAMHRLLQLAANICDAATNRAFADAAPGDPYYPSVFRPIFHGDGSNVFITGFVEEGANNASYRAIPQILPDDAGLIGADTTNIYGVPYAIGARKGFPNFNEIAIQTIAQITRKLELDKGTLDPNDRALWQTNQMFVIGISNILGVEVWNSYRAAYPRAVEIVARNDLTMALLVTNDAGEVLFTTNGSQVEFPPPPVGPGGGMVVSNWPGFPHTLGPSDAALFQIPITADFVFVPDSVYRSTEPHLAAVGIDDTFERTTDFRMPHFVLSWTNRLRFILRDVATGRLVDYVTLDGMSKTLDLTALLPGNDPPGSLLSFWDTNLVSSASGDPTTVPYGVLSQLVGSLSVGAMPLSVWNNAQLQLDTVQSRSNKIAVFSAFYNKSPSVTNLVMQVPFTPTRKISIYQSWQANDPLVHYTLGDISSFPNTDKIVFVVPPTTPTNAIVPNLSRVNDRYRPWGGNPSARDPVTDYNVALKDPLIRDSDDWNFPGDLPLSAAWLGQVHRGTPWQTVYLKSAAVEAQSWQGWTGNADPRDARLTQPTNDWRLASLFAVLVNTNSPQAMLAINSVNSNSWAAAFSDGIPVLTNASPDIDLQSGITPQFAALSMDPGSAQTAAIIDGIQLQQMAEPAGQFDDPGDLLATPELSLNSPWLNRSTTIQLHAGISDIAYEAVPSQMLGNMRRENRGSLSRGNGQALLRFNGYPGFAYEVQVSTNLLDWTALGTAFPSNGVISVVDPDGPDSSRKFYRSKLAP